jgi:hypothetical protein
MEGDTQGDGDALVEVPTAEQLLRGLPPRFKEGKRAQLGMTITHAVGAKYVVHINHQSSVHHMIKGFATIARDPEPGLESSRRFGMHGVLLELLTTLRATWGRACFAWLAAFSVPVNASIFQFQ